MEAGTNRKESKEQTHAELIEQGYGYLVDQFENPDIDKSVPAAYSGAGATKSGDPQMCYV